MKPATRIAIIDDEADARFLLRTALEQSFAEEIAFIAEADSVYKGKELLRTQSVDLVFLDIQLTDGTGFNLLESLSQIDFTIVFVTAHSDFALRAFDFFTFAYLVKPFKQAQLERVFQQFLSSQQPNGTSAIRVLSESIANRRISKVVIAEQEGF
ncbi:MAG: response regulator, partial [Bacteroidota bacterium]